MGFVASRAGQFRQVRHGALRQIVHRCGLVHNRHQHAHAGGEVRRTVISMSNAVTPIEHGVITRAQALQHYTADQIRARLDSGRWVRVFHGVYRSAHTDPTARLRVGAAALSIGKPVTACLHTAAELHGFGVLDGSTTHVIASGAHRPREGIVVHSAVLSPSDRCGTTGCRCDLGGPHSDRSCADRASPRCFGCSRCRPSNGVRVAAFA